MKRQMKDVGEVEVVSLDETFSTITVNGFVFKVLTREVDMVLEAGLSRALEPYTLRPLGVGNPGNPS
jgi:hypothetical protein